MQSADVIVLNPQASSGIHCVAFKFLITARAFFILIVCGRGRGKGRGERERDPFSQTAESASANFAVAVHNTKQLFQVSAVLSAILTVEEVEVERVKIESWT